MARAVVAAFVGALAFGVGVFATPSGAHQAAPARAACSAGYVDGVIGGAPKCLRAGEFCSAAAETDYERYGFNCVDGRLKNGAPTPAATTTAPAPVATTTAPAPAPTAPATPGTTKAPTRSAPAGAIDPGLPVLLKKQTKFSGCKIGPLPDRRCSPGAYASKLTKDVICSPTFRTGSVRAVSTATKHEIEQEYGLTPKSYGRTLEIDHIISLELGGSNDPANLFPEELTLPKHKPGYRIKDKVETKAAKAVCAGTITLSYAQHQIAANWELLYKKLYGAMPKG